MRRRDIFRRGGVNLQKSYCSQFDFKMNKVTLFYLKQLDKGG